MWTSGAGALTRPIRNRRPQCSVARRSTGLAGQTLSRVRDYPVPSKMALNFLGQSRSLSISRWLIPVLQCCSHRISTTSAVTASDREERYIQYSKVPTLHFQPSLPRLPIPKLQETCQRYLAALQPLVTPEQHQHTKTIVEEFGREGGEGEALNRRLILKDSENKHTSYIAGPWYDMYLASRDPLVLNFNPFMAFKNDPRTTDQADRAANFIRSAVRFCASLLAKKLEPEVFHLNPQRSDTQRFRNIVRFVPSTFSWYAAYLMKAFPLDMSQYSRLFNSTRLPRPTIDELVSFDNQRHVVVLRNGHFYTLDAVQPSGLPTPSSLVHSQLLWILSDPTPPPSHPLGYLTTMNRDRWAGLREELVEKEQNRRAVEKIDSALFVLCLDDHEPTTPLDVSHTFLHNYGANRWFDKSFSLIVTKGGLSAINFEHAWGDGVAVLRFFNEVFKDTTQQSPYVPDGDIAPCSDGVERLTFDLSPRLQSAVETAKEEVEGKTRALHFDTLQYEQYGKEFIKQKNLSPDAIMQLTFQIAYYRQFKCSVPSYESCSTAAFRHGRTETIRPASMATKTCAEAFEHSHPAGVEEMEKLVRQASAWHFKLTKEAAMGQGFDRHLFALKTLATAEGLSLPIFQDPSYSHICHIILSTSTLSSDAVLIGGFAPVTPDGYGVGYGVHNDWLGTQVATYPTCDGEEFVANVETVLDNIHDILNGRNFKERK